MFNPAAGELLLRCLRGRALASPCLIFASAVSTTAYVTAYTRAGSTTDVQIVRRYVKALADGQRDVEWVGFDVRSGGKQQGTAAPTQTIPQRSFINPLLLYLTGTKPEQDQAHIDYAASLGITVVTLFSMDELRRYVDTNQGVCQRGGFGSSLMMPHRRVAPDGWGALSALYHAERTP